MTTPRRPAALSAALAAAALLAACSTEEDVPVSTAGPAETATEEDTGVSSDGMTAGPDGDAAAVGAVTAAEEAVPGSRAVSLDREDDDQHVEVTVVADDGTHDVTVSLDGLEVTDQEQDDDVDDEDREELNTATVTMVEAIQTALTQEPGTVEEVELETTDGAVVWEVTLGTDDDEREVVVDAATGDLR